MGPTPCPCGQQARLDLEAFGTHYCSAKCRDRHTRRLMRRLLGKISKEQGAAVSLAEVFPASTTSNDQGSLEDQALALRAALHKRGKHHARVGHEG